jgi:flavorubredoxin
MKVNIAYDSKYGNGKKCVEYLEKVIRAKGHSVDVYFIRKTKPRDLPEVDLYIFSTPTHVGNAPFKMKGFLKKLKIKNKSAKYTVMTTCMDTNTHALDKMSELIQPTGLTKVSDGLKIKVEGMKGPLWDGYQKQIETFANTILTK